MTAGSRRQDCVIRAGDGPSPSHQSMGDDMAAFIGRSADMAPSAGDLDGGLIAFVQLSLCWSWRASREA